MSIVIKAPSGGGSVSLDTQQSVSGDHTLLLPTGVGTADQVLKNGSTPGTLEFAQPKAQPGQIIETISSICNGRSVTVGSGTYTMPNVTQPQYPGLTYEDVVGSSFTYTPPSGTNTVVYEFHQYIGYAGSTAPLGHFRVYLDNTEVTCMRSTSYMYFDGYHVMRIPFSLNNATEDIANGKVGSWTSDKTIKLQARKYLAAYTMGLNRIYHWDGTADPQDLKPTLSITSIA